MKHLSADGKVHADLQLLLELAVEASQHGVGLLVFTDRHLDFPPLPGLQPGKVFSESDFESFFKEPKYGIVASYRPRLEGGNNNLTGSSVSVAVRFI